jgi:hypothetical protein
LVELDIYFNLKEVTLRQLIKRELLVPRTIKVDAGRVMLPPKKG